MRHSPPPAVALAERLCRPQRIGVFGHRGVGKTTLLAMLYREAVGGRLPELRLAAADHRTATYLSDKVLQLEAGQSLAATLAETDLRFHLYQGSSRLELLVRDYQGEHVELGRDEPIGAFLRDCDAVWLCLDTTTLWVSADRWQRQQEVEQLLEGCLTAEGRTLLDRPTALVLTKADLLGADQADLEHLTGERFDMVRHALRTHCPLSGLFAVSSLGGSPSKKLKPRNLDQPLRWLLTALQAQDEARLERLWTTAGVSLILLARCVECFARRYPDAPRTKEFKDRLRVQYRQRTWRRIVGATTAAAALLGLVWSYDAAGRSSAARFASEHADEPAAILQRWQRYQAWHPTRHWTLGDPENEARAVRAATVLDHHNKGMQRLLELTRLAEEPEVDAAATWREFRAFDAAHPEMADNAEVKKLQAALLRLQLEQRQVKAQRAHDELLAAEQRSDDLGIRLAQADRFLRDFTGTPPESDVRRLRDAYLARIDDRDIEFARNYSAKQPLNFQTRRESYQRYLDRHPAGQFTSEATLAIQQIEAQWDRHDFRQVRDQFVARPGDVAELVAGCRAYLAAHPRGEFVSAAVDLLRWSERVTAAGEYRVRLVSGSFDAKITSWFSRGPDLSVELEVAGVRYGPSSIVANSLAPEWDYEFPRPIKWKLGDPVRIRVTDHDWGAHVVVDVSSEEGDRLGIRLLNSEAWSGANRITFASDFALPVLPKIE